MVGMSIIPIRIRAYDTYLISKLNIIDNYFHLEICYETKR
ncbi:hypothetical Protein YC6258_03437 [Gynuella sunshinyii YC6258]|uniref:Uncharacterized protein n=1 Tax=Gynuella sunshinyii YC6258 TaxID=1445510 RepID=A0A0C5VPV1_9GAMM|nr:hypothetical Protein YC6258_03437 [Gynuella sunshinyii YC6258]